MRTSLVLFFAVLVLVVFNNNAQDKEHPGQKVFMDSKCQTCHSVESKDITSKSKKAKDLSNVGAVYRANFLEKFLMKEDKINSKQHPQVFKGTKEELNSLAEWLQTLNTGRGDTEDTGKKEEMDKPVKDTSGTKK